MRDIAIMFTREEVSRTRQEFWTTFGKYMNPVPSAEGQKINWINYRTGVKHVYFRMETLEDRAAIYISIEHSDPGIRELFFEQFIELKEVLRAALEEDWEWQKDVQVGTKSISRIYKDLPAKNVANRDDWPELISFFKERMIKLDAFWENAKLGFEGLG